MARNFFLGREITGPFKFLKVHRMESETRKALGDIGIEKFSKAGNRSVSEPAGKLSGGERNSALPLRLVTGRRGASVAREGGLPYASGALRQVTIYHQPGRYAAWPALFGIWSWGNEIVVGFGAGYVDPGGGYHARDRSRPIETLQARSTDGGATWHYESFPGHIPGGRGLAVDEHVNEEWKVQPHLDGPHGLIPCPGEIDFTAPGVALMAVKTGLAAGVRSLFYLSDDRCRSWQGPYPLPMFGQTGIAARTDYLIDGPGQALLFLTANKRDGREGRVFCAETGDGGRTFSIRSWIGPEPDGFSIMPASVRLDRRRILVATRRRDRSELNRERRDWIDLYRSDDAGRSWRLIGRPVEDAGFGGNSPTLMRLHDGRLCLTYGLRGAPFGMRASLSDDEGSSWGSPIMLRDGAGNHDLGYPRTVQTADGKVVTIYYFNDDPAGERYLAATLWDPP